MCGIWGYVGNEAIENRAAWDGLCSLTDRGPDDWGLYVEGRGKLTEEREITGESRVAFGNRRLSILDLSEAGNQPMTDGEDNWIAYNGEVYNYREIRDELRDKGYEFETETDTEVILHAYNEYGASCVEHFRGMFAFAIYDTGEGTFFFARDRFGIKPFYYDHRGGHFAFASEVTSLLDAGVTDRVLNPEGVDGFLTFGYVPGPRTIIEGVRSLPPGSTMEYDPATDERVVTSYWEPTFGGGDEGDAERVRDLLKESVKLRLRSDVPVGAFLSGGLDSSTIVALMREVAETDRNDLHTYAVGFENDQYSETQNAETVAETFDTVHHSETVTADDVADALDEIVAQMDQPTVDGVNTYFVSKLAANDGLKVALSGLGSDELFYGYPSFESVPRRYKAAASLYTIPQLVRQPIAGAVERLSRPLLGDGAGKVADAIDAADPFGAAYLSVRGLFSRRDRERLHEGDPIDWTAHVGSTVADTLDESGQQAAVSEAELTWYMRDQLLRQTDIMSMAHSLEVRVPFLDGELAEYVTNVPVDVKRKGEKGLLKEAIIDLVPLEIIEREKTGFEFPFAEWLYDDLDNVVTEVLSPEQIANTPLDPTTVDSVRRGFDNGDVHWSRVWALVILSRWVEEQVYRET